MSVSGWSAYAAYLDRSASGQEILRQLLAIRLAYDTALLSLHENWQLQIVNASAPIEAKHIAQTAAEHAFRTSLAAKLLSGQTNQSPLTRKALQAVFCIDVRSEAYRSALEAQSPAIQTIGFAGFFGMPVEFESSPRCPVLIQPPHEVHACPRPSRRHPLKQSVSTIWKTLVTSASACFPAVELGGAWFGLSIFKQLLKSSNKPDPVPPVTGTIPLLEKVDWAAGALKNMSVNPNNLAPIVLFCGHGSSTENNPYAASLDCGACGGHKGDLNARFAAALLNDPAVRQALQARGLALPEDTIFVAGLHITTTDEVILFETELLSQRQLSQLASWLNSASHTARRQRIQSSWQNAAQPVADTNTPQSLYREAQRRSADWSEVRPEWGLAGNAAFIAAPRSRTNQLDLAGRAFLHDYDPVTDHDGSVLQLILTAPVIVASWINLQYYASTVNNRLWGSGNKVLHNVVAKFGIWEGNGGDLRTGLPLQSLHDGANWIHQPLRLQVFIEAPRTRIDMVLQNNPNVKMLVENDWIALLAIDGNSIYRRHGPSDWR